MNRRKFIRTGFWGLTGVTALSGLYAWQMEPFWLEFVKMKMPIKNLPAQLSGKTLMQISDIHIGNRFNHQYIIDSFKKAKEFAPDIVVYTGDYITLHKGEVQYEKLEEVLQHAVKGTIGTLAILGNHDYGKNWREAHVANKISTMLEKYGITVLRNNSIDIAGLRFIGFDDFWALNFNPQKAMSHFDKDKASIVLCHNPDVCDFDVWSGYDGWILSGHTHGGQCKPPFLPPPIVPVSNKKYTAGKFNLADGRTLYINRALGHSIQVRFNVRPEITLFEMQRA